eukprot:scaffold93793_cov19-Tisochrysis_lutea.AAC.2
MQQALSDQAASGAGSDCASSTNASQSQLPNHASVEVNLPEATAHFKRTSDQPRPSLTYPWSTSKGESNSAAERRSLPSMADSSQHHASEPKSEGTDRGGMARNASVHRFAHMRTVRKRLPCRHGMVQRNALPYSHLVSKEHRQGMGMVEKKAAISAE